MRRIAPGWRNAFLALLATGAGMTPFEAALAQARGGNAAVPVERNLPPVVAGRGGLVIGPQDLAAGTDDTPLGVAVSGIHLIGAKENVPPRVGRGVTLSAIGEVSRPAVQQALTPFLGRPLTRKLISDMQAAIAKVYREAGFPFVSITLPPQEVTGGGLALRVVEFRIGGVKVNGAAPGTEADLARKVRAAPGHRIAAEALEEDLDWLNRYPYRSVSGVFAPGDDLGLSTLTLEVTPQKPWQAFAGWSNTGTHATGFDRYFVGFGAALPLLGDSFLSYQVTGSPDFWTDPASVGTGPAQPSYYSQAARFVVPLGERQSIEVVPNYVASRQADAISAFTYENTTFELPVYYRTAISNLVPGMYLGDVILGATGKSVSRTSYFTGTDIGGAEAGLFELSAGWAVEKSDAFGRTGLDLRLVANPGGVVGGNSASNWASYSGGRVDDVTYVYGTIGLNRVTRLPLEFSWVSQFTGTLAGQALPDTEQISLGGLYATRGYTLDDGNADTGVVWRNELRLPPFAALSTFGLKGVIDQMSPYAFFDMGWGHNYGYQSVLGPVKAWDVQMASLGVGLDYTLARNLTTSVAVGAALTDAGYTQAGDWTVQTRIYLSY